MFLSRLFYEYYEPPELCSSFPMVLDYGYGYDLFSVTWLTWHFLPHVLYEPPSSSGKQNDENESWSENGMMKSEWHFSRHFWSGWSDEKNEIFQFFRRRILGKKNDGSMCCGNFSSPNDGRTSVGRRH